MSRKIIDVLPSSGKLLSAYYSEHHSGEYVALSRLQSTSYINTSCDGATVSLLAILAHGNQSVTYLI